MAILSSAASQNTNMRQMKYYMSELNKYLARQAQMSTSVQFVSALGGEIVSLRPWSDAKRALTSYLGNVTLFPIDSAFLAGVASMLPPSSAH